MNRADRPAAQLRSFPRIALLAALLLLCGQLLGCATGPTLLSADQRQPIDRRLVEYPAGYQLTPHVTGLTAPSAIAFDANRSLLIAESGADGREPKIFGFKETGEYFQIYPTGRRLPFGLDRLDPGFRLYGPVGGMIAEHDKVYVSHRDRDGKGVITAFDYQGNPTTIVSGLPAQGDYGVTDIAIKPSNGRLYFGVGTATNSGVVGIDNWARGWVRRHPDVADHSAQDVKLLGYRFDTPNPKGGLLGGDDIAVTAPFQPFGRSNQTRIPGTEKPNGAIYSVSPTGGDLRVEATGLHNPRGLAFNDFEQLYVANTGMELRGTRPIKDDPDVLLRLVNGAWYGWPDYSADLNPIGDRRYQPPVDMIIRHGYPDVSALIDHAASGLSMPDKRLIYASFPQFSGAAKLDFGPSSGPLREFRGKAILALSGDRAPFANSGRRLKGPIGHKVMMVDVDRRRTEEFIYNTEDKPASRLGDGVMALERPIDVKFGPDGALYLLDYGQMRMKEGQEDVAPGTGRIYRLTEVPEEAPPPPAGEDSSPE